MATSFTEQLSELSPSAKLVFYVLKHQSPLTQKEICDEALVAHRTVRYALKRLDKNELIKAQIPFSDARQQLYAPSEVSEAVTYTEQVIMCPLICLGIYEGQTVRAVYPYSDGDTVYTIHDGGEELESIATEHHQKPTSSEPPHSVEPMSLTQTVVEEE